MAMMGREMGAIFLKDFDGVQKSKFDQVVKARKEKRNDQRCIQDYI